MEKPADTPLPVLAEVRRRWSPVAFDPRPVAPDQLRLLFEAARWSASSFNEQPWRFLVATADDSAAFARALGCLVESNRAWAKSAAVLVFPVAKKTFTRNHTPNRVAAYDVGQAVATFVLQATALGLFAHQMGGILPDQVRAAYGVPDDFDPLTAVAVGHPYTGDPAALPGDLRSRQLAARDRKPLAELVFAGSWGKPAG